VCSSDLDSVFTWAEWRSAFVGQLGKMVGLGAFFLLVVSLATRYVSQGSLAIAGTTWAALGVGLALAGTGNASLAPTSFGVAFLLAGLFWAFRSIRKNGRLATFNPVATLNPVTTLEWLFRMAALGLLPGAVVSLAAPTLDDVSIVISSLLFMTLIGAVVLGLIPLAIAGFVRMRRSVEWFIAIRYLVAQRRQVFISAITAICVGGIAVGVWLIIVVLSVMNGFEQTWRDEILGNRAHFTVHNSFGPFVDHEEILEMVESVSGVEAASPYIDAEGMVRGSQGQIASVRLRGIDPATVGNVTDLEHDMQLINGEETASLVERFASIAPDAKAPGIIIGGHLAVSMGLGIGDRLLLISPFGGPPTPLGPGPKLKRFTVVGIFESSFYQYDEAFTYTTLDAARDFRKAGDVVDGIEARTTDHYRSQAVGLRAAKTTAHKVGEIEFLLSERYDRTIDENGVIHRLHQEDVCQALGIPSEIKYQVEGGPGLKECFALLRIASSNAVADLRDLLDAVMFNLLIGNNDSHAKNYSILYGVDGKGRLAPLYDLVCTAYSPEIENQLAMKIGGQANPDLVYAKEIEAFARDANLGVAQTRRRVIQLAELVRTRVADIDKPDETAEKIARLIADRCDSVLSRFTSS
jgi:hypothetical protein